MSIRPLGPSSEHTRSAVLDMVRSGGTVSRIELAERSGLTATSITRIVKSLIDDGLVIETGLGDSTGGKRRSLLELNRGARFGVGMALDHGRLDIVAVDLGGALVGRRVSRGIGESPPRVETMRLAQELDQLFRQLDLPLGNVVGVGVAGAGLDLSARAEQLSPTAEDWDEFDLENSLGSLVGLPVVRDNDAACAALGQFWGGRIPATQDFATLYMANGFGLGVVSGGRLSRGASSNVGEIGHVTLDIDGPACWCGSQGCLEALAAPRAMVAQAFDVPGLAEELGLVGDDSRLRSDFTAVSRAAAAGHLHCLRIVERSARYVAAAVLSAVNLLDLDRVYLAGPGFADVGAVYLRAVRDKVSTQARTRDVHPVRVELSDPGFSAAAVGAASLALQHVVTPHTRTL